MTRAFSLDTSACIDLIRGRNLKIRRHFAQTVEAGHTVAISSIALHELSFGAARSHNPEASRNVLNIFVSGVVVLEFDSDDALVAGEIRAHLAVTGNTIGPFDTLIAAQALRRKLTLVSDNVREFKRVRGLSVENWSK